MANAIGVGPGIAAQLAANGDAALYREEAGTVTDPTTQQSYSYEKVWGSKGLYVSSNASGAWVNVGPFGLAE